MTTNSRRPASTALLASRGRIMAIWLFSAAVNLLMLNGALYMLQVYDRVLNTRGTATLATVTLLLLFLFAVQAAIDILRQRLLVLSAREVEARLRGPAHRATLHEARSGLKASHPLKDLATVRNFLAGAGPSALLDLPWAPVFIALAFAIHPGIGLALLGGAVLMVTLTIVFGHLTRRHAAVAAEAQGRLRFRVEAERRQAQNVIAMGLAGNLCRRHDRDAAVAAEAEARAAQATGGAAAMARAARLVLQSLILGLGALFVIRGELTAGAMIATSIIAGRALAPLDAAIVHWRPMQAARCALRRLDASLATPEPAVLALPLPSRSLAAEGLAVAAGGRVIAQGVSFGLRAGEVLGIVGPSGVGKSSLMRVLAGIEAPAAGELRLDGARAEQLAPERRGAATGYVAQEAGLLEGTVAENIARMDPNPAAEAVIAAARLVGVHEMILALPQGYDTPVGDASRPLSGGQKQRIALARAFHGDPFLILLDEANANLDAEGEQAFAEAVRAAQARGAIVVIVTHRMGTLALASHVLILADGRQTTFGPRDAVLRPTPAETPRPLRATA